MHGLIFCALSFRSSSRTPGLPRIRERRRLQPNVPSLFAVCLAACSVFAPCASAQEQKAREFQECHDCPVMLAIPAGRFMMGSEKSEPGRFENEGPRHVVAVRAFALGKYDVTSEEFLTFLRATGYQPKPCNPILDMKWHSMGNGLAWPPYDEEPRRWPAACLDWNDANAYIAWLNAEVRGEHPQLARRAELYRLPSEVGVGICGARRHRNGAVVGRCDRRWQCRLQWLRQPLGRQRTRGRRQFCAQSVRALRHARQCVAMDGGLLARIPMSARRRTAARGKPGCARSTSSAAVRGTMCRF